MSCWKTIDAIYLLCHPEKEPSRWKRMQEHLLERGVPKEKWVQIAPSWGDQINESAFELYDPFCVRPGCPYFSWKGRNLSKGEISLTLNFWYAVDHAIQNKYKTVVFFESDVFLRDDFTKRMGELITLLEKQAWDFVSLSDGVGTNAKRNDMETNSVFAKTSIYPPPYPFPFRCTDSMLFRVKFLQNIRKTAFPFRDCLDWELNYQLAIHKGIALWVEPHLVEQGTCKNRMISLLPS